MSFSESGYSLSSPAPGINIYTITVICTFLGYTDRAWTQYTGLELDYSPSGEFCQSDYREGPLASVSGVCTGRKGRAYASSEIRGTSSGILYLESDVIDI